MMISLPSLELIDGRLKNYSRKTLSASGLTPAAVTLPLAVGPHGALEVLFTLRSHDVEHHKGEISFPGGKIEPSDRDAVDAALRETFEETGIAPSNARVLGLLDDQVSVTGFLVTPVAIYLPGGWCGLTPSAGEVCEIFSVPLSHLADRANYRDNNALASRDDRHEFRYEGRRIWGLTASVLHRFMEITLDF